MRQLDAGEVIDDMPVENGDFEEKGRAVLRSAKPRYALRNVVVNVNVPILGFSSVSSPYGANRLPKIAPRVHCSDRGGASLPPVHTDFAGDLGRYRRNWIERSFLFWSHFRPGI